MNTPAHLILAAAVFSRPGAARVNAAALAGGILPDLSLYLLAGGSLYVLGLSPQRVFDELYFSPAWQGIFAVDNSIPLWTLGLVAALALRSAPGIAFAGSGLMHVIADFLLHHDDARRQFWPLTDWVFRSPVSYWDSRHFGQIVGPTEVAVCVVLTGILWRRFRGRFARGLIALGMLLELAPAVMFGLMFAGH